MKLNKNNLKDWLKKLDIESNRVFGYDLSHTLTDKQWIEECEDMTPEDFIYEEINSCL